MVSYRAASYGANINAGVNVNADHGWGGHCWPAGVPAHLLGWADYKGVRSQVRIELVALYSLAYAIALEIHGYVIHTTNPNGNGEPWGPWGYENRAISGSSTASNHSKGKANDWNAPYNGYADGFRNITSDFPPAMVADLERIGLAWGGRYGDAMHWEYAYGPTDVPGHVLRAVALLKGSAPTTPPTDEDILMGSIETLIDTQRETNHLLTALLEQSAALNTRGQAQTDNLAGMVEQLAAVNTRLAAIAARP